MPSDLIVAAGADCNGRKDERCPARLPRDHTSSEFSRQAIAQNSIREGGKIWTVFLKHPALKKHDGAIAIEIPDLSGVEIADANDLGLGGRCAKDQGEGGDSG